MMKSRWHSFQHSRIWRRAVRRWHKFLDGINYAFGRRTIVTEETCPDCQRTIQVEVD